MPTVHKQQFQWNRDVCMEIVIGIIIGTVLNSIINVIVLKNEEDLLFQIFAFVIFFIYDAIRTVIYKIKKIFTAPLYCYLRYDRINKTTYYVPYLKIKRFDKKYRDKYTVVENDKVLNRKLEEFWDHALTAYDVERMRTARFKIKEVEQCGIKIAPELLK